MNLRTYRARTMGDALAEVKKDLGRDAVILHTRTFKVGGWLGLGAKSMVEVTASDSAAEVRKVRSGNIAALKAYGVPEPAADRGTPARPPVDLAAQFVAARNETSVSIAAPTTPVPEKIPVVRTGPVTVVAPPPAIPDPIPSGDFEAKPSKVGEELAAIRKMMGQVLQCSRQTAMRIGADPASNGSGGGTGAGGGAATALATGPMSDPVFQIYARLLEAEVASDIADELIARLQRDLTAPQLTDESAVHAAAVRYLSAMIPADAETPRPAAHEGRPLTLALIGPTGVGKTTTVAKLAATYKLRHGKRVGLVTSDTYRIAAVDQLRTYAEIIGLPLKVAMSPADIASCCQSLSDCDIILIDTAGRSPRDSGRVDELRQYIDASRPHQTHLVLSSVSSESVLMEAAKRFLPVKPDRVIFTKLDEAVNLGTIVTVARRISLRLSYVTTGQEVPDHIEPGKPERLARLLLSGTAVAAPVAGSIAGSSLR